MDYHSLSLWVIFNIAVIALLVLDLVVFHGSNKTIPVKAALKLSAFWVSLALLFNLFILAYLGQEAALTFFTGYLIEKSLSVDNIFVFLYIFTVFKVEEKFQHRILFLGILGALLMRALFIFLGIAALERFEYFIYVLGVFLIVSGIRLMMSFSAEKEEESIEDGPRVVQYFARVMQSLPRGPANSCKFWIKTAQGWRPTQFFIVLIAVEISDVVFALDSIPAILAISHDPFIVYSSNVCAILGLRALYFALAGLRELFEYLDHGLSLILVLIGLKIVVKPFVEVPAWLTLISISIILGGSFAYSIYKARQNHAKELKALQEKQSSKDSTSTRVHQ